MLELLHELDGLVGLGELDEVAFLETDAMLGAYAPLLLAGPLIDERFDFVQHVMVVLTGEKKVFSS